MPAPATPLFSRAALRFLTQLKAHNTRPWFEAHRAEYETLLKAPLQELVEELDTRLATLAPEIVGDVKRSVFRIHRDVRFSKDKSPYKTHVACWFYHRRAGKGVGSSSPDGGAAGFYVHIEPGAAMVGGGLWMPPRPALTTIRAGIVERQREFERTLKGPFAKQFGALTEEGMLVRLPRGFEAGHPAERWLRYQSFTAGRPLTVEEVTSAKLPAIIATAFGALRPFVRFLNSTLGYPADTTRLA
jgi:uncharacterized protein (TIGR02453 family)